MIKERGRLMRKRVLSFALAASMTLSLLSGFAPGVKAYAADDDSGNTGSQVKQREIDSATYKDLNLNLTVDESEAAVPYSETGVTSLVTGNEIYVEANGRNGNKYTVRDGFDRWQDRSEVFDRKSDINDDWGNLDGAYDYYDISPNIKGKKGGTIGSKLSSNRGNSLSNSSAGFSGIYATSVSFDGGDNKENYIAELRAYGYNDTCTFGGKTLHGKIEVAIMKVSSNGQRSVLRRLSPTLTANNVYGGDRLSYFTRVYAQDMDALFEIEKADVDGDGLDDLLVYCGAYEDDSDGNRYALVNVYMGAGSGYFSSTQVLRLNCGPASYFQNSNDWKHILRRTPVVTIAGGDFERDGTSDVAVAVSAPTEHSNVSSAARLSVYSYDRQERALETIDGLDSISLSSGDGKAMVSANCAFGQFTLQNSSVTATVLIAGGYQSNCANSNANTDTYRTAAYRYIYKDPETNKYRISDYQTKDLGRKSLMIADSYSNARDGHQRPIHAPLALACADLDGMTGGNKNDSVLFGGEVYSFVVGSGLDSEIGSLSVCRDQVRSKSKGTKKEQTWIGDVRVGCVDADPARNGYRESFVAVVGTHRDAKTNSGDDYYWMDISAFGLFNGEAYSSQEGVIAESNSRNDNYGTFVSLCLPDIDNDAVKLRFNSKSVMYSDPEVYAVLQASPYFSDVQESYEYINNGGTSYSTSTGSSESNSGNISQSVGVYVETEVQLFGSADFESEVSAGASYEYSKEKETEYEISYNAAGGGSDHVVVYCQKYMYYMYDMYVPQTNSWDTIIMPVSLGPSTSVIDVDTYDIIANKTKGLNPIRGTVLKNTPGDPASYRNSLGGKQEYVNNGGGDSSYSSVVASSGADQTQTISTTTTNSHSIEVFVEINLKVGGGAGFLGNKATAGVTSSTHAGYGHSWSNSKGTTYSGTVDNLPEDCSNYSFDWQLRVNRHDLNGSNKPVWIVGYDVKNVVRPPYAPQNLSIVDVTKDSVELTWDPSSDAAYYEIYLVDGSGNYNRKAVVPYTVTDYVVGGLYSNRTYTFATRTIDSKGEASIYSKQVSATTLQNSANFKITQSPKDTSTYAGGTAEFRASAVYTDENGKNQSVGYIWQVDDGNGWETMKRASSPVLRLTNVENEMNGNKYRCRLYYNDITLYTPAGELLVDRADSRVELSMDKVIVQNGSDETYEALANEAVVRGDGSIANYSQKKQYSAEAVQFIDGEIRYSLMTDGTHYVWTDSNGNYYPCKYSVKLDADKRMEECDKVFGISDMDKDAPYGSTETDYKAEISIVTSNTDGSTSVEDKTIDVTKQKAEDYAEDTVTYKETVSEKKTVDGVVTETETEVEIPTVITEKWVDADAKYEFYMLTRTDDPDETIYCYRETGKTDVHDCRITSTMKLQLDNDTLVDYSSLKGLDRTVSEMVTVRGDDTLCDGDTIILTAGLIAGDAALAGEKVVFSINGPVEQQIDAVYDSTKGCYTARWKPAGEGTYTVYAKFDGNDKYNGSQSDTMTIYTSYDCRKNVSLAVEKSVKYGDVTSFALNEIDSANGETKDVSMSNKAKYTIYNTDKGVVTGEAPASEYDLNGNEFTPKKVGIYRVEAAYTDDNGNVAKDVKDIKVTRAEMSIEAVDTDKGINDADRSCMPAVVRGLKTWDKAYMPKEGVDYELQSQGTTVTKADKYEINSILIEDSEGNNSSNIQKLSENYDILTKNAVYDLKGNVYVVKAATANTHGDIAIKYNQADSELSEGLIVDNGTKLPENSIVTFIATPATGYKVKSWTVNGKKYAATQTGTVDGVVYSEVQIQVQKLSKNMNVVVDYEPIYYKLNYASEDTTKGIVSAAYIADGVKGNSFASGSNVHIEQTIRLTAEPKSGYAVDHWTVTGADGVETTILSDDGVSYYTDVIYDVSKVSEDKTFTAYFAEADNFDISVALETLGADGTRTAASGAELTVTAKRDEQVVEIEKNENGKYNVQRGDNIIISVTVPSGLLINGWTAADEDTMGTVSTDLKSMTVFNVTKSADYTVTYTAPNKYSVNFEAEDTKAGKVVAELAGTAGKLRSGDRQFQGSKILLTAQPNDGYEVAYWTVDGEKVSADAGDDGIQTYTIESLSHNTSVLVYFYKKPVITFSADNDTEVTAKSGDADIANGACIAYADKSALAFASETKKGYEIADIVVTYGDAEVYRLSDDAAHGEDVLSETAGAAGTEKYTFTWKSPEEGFTENVDVAFTYKEITPSVKADYSLDLIEKDPADPSKGKSHGSIKAGVSRKDLSAYVQTGEAVGDETENKKAEVTDIYRDSVIAFKVTPDVGYNVKEWIVDGQKLTSETENIKLTSDKKTNDTLLITVTGDSTDITVMARLELIGDVLTFGPETEGTGEVSAVIRRSGVKLVSGDMLGTTADVEFTAVSAEGYEVADWLVNGISQKVTDDVFTYKVPKDTRADVRAVFDRPFYNITWSSDEGGQIKAENVTAAEVLEGNSAQIRGDRELKFTADADQYMECTGFTVKTAEGTKDYTAEELGSNVFVVDKVASDIDVVAHFAKQELKSVITFEANDAALGTVTAVYGLDKKAEITSGDSQVSGGDVVFTAAPAEGQMIEGWYLDPECTQAIEGTGLEQTTYEVKTIYSDVAVYVKFVEIPEYTVKVGTTGTGSAKITAASDGEELEIVSGEVKLKRHKDLTITVTPKDEYNTVEHWIVDGNEVASEELKYEITDITADTTVYAYIAPSLLVNVIFKNEDEVKKYDNINISTGYVGEDGDISGLKPINAENNSVRIGSGKDVRFAITPSDDYMIQSWTVKYIRGGNVVKEESGEDFGFVNDILLENVTNNIEVSAELVDREGYVIPAEGNYGRDNVKIEEASEETTEVAYTVSELTKTPDNVVFKDTNGNILDNVVRKNGDASVVITPAEGWRIRDIILGESDDNEEGSGEGNDQPDGGEGSNEGNDQSDDGEGSNEGNDQSNGGEDPASSENIMKVQPVLAEDGTETGAYLVTAENVTKNVQFKVDAVKLYTVTITETEHGSVKVTRADGTEVKSGEQLDEETMLTYKATPDKYYDFDTWTDDAADQTESTFEQALDGNITVGAAFKARYAKVNIASVKNGKITVTTADGKKIANGQLVQEGTVIVCKAVSAKHCDLSAWGGDAKGKKGGTVKLTVTKNMKISAAFKYRYVKIAIGKTVNGTISVKTADGKTVKNGSAIKEGTVIVCTAKAAKNCKLGYWSGSFKSTNTSVRVAANNNMTINAKFVAQIPARDTAGINKNIQTAITNKSLTIKWGKVAGADGYDVFMQNCSKKMDTKNPVKTVRGASSNKTTITKMHGTALSKCGIVKIQVKAYKLVNGKKKYIDKSVLLHIVLNSEKRTNIKKVTLAKKAYTMSVKRAVTLKPVFTPANASKLLLGAEHGPRAFYYSTNTNVAIVDANGVVKAKASGKCTIYVISISGVSSPVQITVR